ncbi:DUF2339 domain-containing protein [Geomesophilobacter sediminis]|uniref:DUF2339 domain-containing protein n=1 Tax=Geomesophilobacter sediminis TaxID=2798584 RepID=A0A8J7M3A8_9BACT|nr:DUF2339 domain-containing protein [Geomesophilobacter sediminis]MBJ6727857.1 DUF2339 domain-containing protein [Geomesophilobacter sediminis]
MTEKASLEQRVEELSAELSVLRDRLARLEGVTLTTAAGVAAPTPATAPAAAAATDGTGSFGAPPLPAVPAAGGSLLDEPEDVSEELLNWAGKAHLLTRLSTLCFLLVIALILRTVTDNNLINTLVGSGLGMGYAAALMLIGAYRYEKQSPLAPIFAASGAVLMATIVVETHQRFASLPLVPAYLTLIATGGGMAWVSYRHKKLLPVSLGILGMCLAGAAIDYPHPFFPYLSLILFAANILGYFAAELKSCSWLRWIVLAVTMAMMQLWAVRLGMNLLAHTPVAPELGQQWFLPALAAFTLLYLGLAFTGIVRRERITRFDFALPTLNALWAFSAAAYVSHCWWGTTQPVGFLGLILAVGHLATTGWLVGRNRAGAPGTNSFAFAGAALSAAALPFASGYFLLSLPVLSVGGFFLALLSRKWKNGGVRATSYLLQLYTVAALSAGVYFNPAAAADLVNALPAGLLAVICLYHYQWCREWAPPEASFFSRYDRGDFSAVALLMAALASGFITARIAALQVLTLTVTAAEVPNAFRCSQSVIINTSAAALMLAGFFLGKKELRNIAILLTLVGGVKVFLYDLLGTHGVPLVVSVFSFGLAAAVESVALGRWKGDNKARGDGPLTIDKEELSQNGGPAVNS